MGFIISTEYDQAYTHIPNWFIRTYLPSANGNFVKTYLYLAMAAQHPLSATDLSVSSLADHLECTENDIVRALHYWQKEGIVRCEESGGEIQSVVLSDRQSQSDDRFDAPVTAAAPEIAPEPVPETAAAKEPIIPARQVYTPLQAEALIKDVEIDQTITQIEQMLGKTISSAHLQMILYFMCDVGFSKDLILAMYRAALDNGKSSPSYIEAIGINWAKKGITTPEQAETESSNYTGTNHVVAKALGIQRSLAPAEKEIIDSWRSYGFSDEILQEACRRTVLQTGGTNLKYVSSILDEWHRLGVTTASDIEKCDRSFQRQKKNRTERKTSVSKNQFQNFPQRVYTTDESNSLEKQLLQGQA